MSPKRAGVVAVAAMLLVVSAPCTRGQGSQSSAPPAVAGSAPQQGVQSPLPPGRVRVGGNVIAAQLLHMVPPVYPAIARTERIEGTVVLHAVIAKDGTIKELQFVSGPPLLIRSAMDAVKQWTYKPYLLNGEAVEVDTTINVVFALGDAPASASEKPIDPQLKADIAHLLDVMNVKQNIKAMGQSMSAELRPTIIASLPPTPHREQIADAYLSRMMALVESSENLDQMVALYAKYFSDEDIKALTAFYATPTGQHFNSVSAQLFDDMTQAEQQMVRENLVPIMRELCKEYPELSGKTRFCPAAEQPKSSGMIRPSNLVCGASAAFGGIIE